MFFYSDLRYKVQGHSGTYMHTHKFYLRTEEGKRRYFVPGLTIHLFFAPNEGFLFQLRLVLISVWSIGQAGPYVYTTVPQIMPRSPNGSNLYIGGPDP